MRTSRIVALIVGCLLVLPGIAALVGGAALGIGYAAGRNESGYFQAPLTELRTSTAAIVAQTPAVTTDVIVPQWLMDALDSEIRLRVTAVSTDSAAFVGVGPAAAVDGYLDGIAHDEIIGLTNGVPLYRATTGVPVASPPPAQTFWAASATGTGTQELNWAPSNGAWAVVVMNADGSPGIDATGTVEIRAGFLLPLALTLLAIGLVLTAGAGVLIVVGASGMRSGPQAPSGAGFPGVGVDVGPVATADRPVVLTAYLDPGLSRWQWLVKWFLAIPHYLVLAFLWPAFLLVTVVAGVCILIAGRYPRSLFDFTTGVLRWTWRVSYYAASGGIGTDRYPPFTLGVVADYPATLDIAYPGDLSRGLVLVKWWLLALPHFVVIALVTTNWWSAPFTGNDGIGWSPAVFGGILGLATLVAGITLLITGRYPGQLFDPIVGFNRWIYRVICYATLMTDRYPPFRLDQGGSEPTAPQPPIVGPSLPRRPEPVSGPAS